MCSGTLPGSASSRDAQLRHDQRQDGSDDRTEVDQEGLYHIALGFLPVVEHVGYQGPEGLHRDIEREIHEEQDEGSHGQRGESQQPRAVGHEGQRQRRDDRTPQDVGNAAAQTGPRSVREEPDDRLDDHAGQRCREPEIAQVAYIGTQRFENARRIGVLERISDLYAEKSEAEVPNLPKGEFGLVHSVAGCVLGHTNFNKKSRF